mgnify:CR=1 FL=1
MSSKRNYGDGCAMAHGLSLVGERWDGEGTPVSFLDVHVPAHLAFYRAGIAAITSAGILAPVAPLIGVDRRRRPTTA